MYIIYAQDKKVGEFKLMAKVVVKDGELNDALKRFSRITAETRRVAKKHEYYLRPGLRAKEKSKEARKFQKKPRHY